MMPLHLRILAVEDPQRIAAQAALAVLIEGRGVPAEIGRELVAISRARSRRPQGVHPQFHAVQSQKPQEPRGQQNHLRIDIRPFESERFGIDLMKLPKASRLRTLAPEHRSHAPHPQASLAQQPVGNDRAHDAGGRLGAQRDLILALIDETEHFLFDDVGKIADRALE